MKWAMMGLLLAPEGWGKILALDIQGRSRLQYSYSEVCENFGHRDHTLLERVSYRQLDCMGRKVSVEQFCRDRHGLSPLYLRGYLPVRGEAVCEKGMAVTLHYQCKKNCPSPRRTCLWLGESFARNLSLSEPPQASKKGMLTCQYHASR